MTLRVLADENIPGLESLLPPGASLRRKPGRQIRRADLRECDALLVRSVTPVNAELLAGTPVRFVGTATSGFDHIDREWLSAQGVAFAFAPGCNANSVVEYVLCAIAEVDDFLERLLAGGRVGIVGYGVIGRALAARLAQLGIASVACDPWLAPGSIPHPATLAEILACDVISLHTSLVDTAPWPSRHLLAAPELAALNSGQLLINAARGPVADNAALLQCLQAPDAPAVVLDVWEKEPRVEPALLQRVRLGSAHIAGYSLDGKLAATRVLCQALAKVFELEYSPSTKSGAQAALALDSAASVPDTLRSLLAARYRVADDDRLLREAVLGCDTDTAAGNFDRLRKQYRERRELAGSQVQLPAGTTTALERWVTALGCTVAVAKDGA
ncbi:4-phosphoerythronate dehydrogenase [Mangrovimicrobium sediminis]|uniref:4-phosphoerythronate dehydrogenase n=1 Tax=Mangrovimicrobium sediminis TaxID=2562682 RepID=UPI0014368153|nr:4-phosphoerythronate dehydrogenase [Haliea sp. SAOS-164]